MEHELRKIGISETGKSSSMYDNEAIHETAINDPRFAGGNPNGIFALEGTWEWVSPMISSNEH
jgi:hypothetical protein